MTLTPAQTELYHLALLRVLDGNATRFGLIEPALRTLVRAEGFEPTERELTDALDYMADPEVGFVTQVNKGQFNSANRAWKITARGTNQLRERGL